MPDQIRPRVLAVANQKGGVGKTTTSINLGASLAELGQSILVVDLDPQGNASTGLGIDMALRSLSTYDVVLDGAPIEDVVQATRVKNLYIAPATTDLSSADIELVQHENRVFLLKDAFAADGLARYDYVLIDCPPSLNLLTVNAMAAANGLLVPLQAEFYALEGLSQLMRTVQMVRDSANPKLRIEGVVLTMFDQRNNLCRLVEKDARDNLGRLVFETVIPRNVRLSEAPSYSLSILQYDPKSTGSNAYRQLAREIMDKQLSPA